MKPALCIVIPTLDEAATIRARIEALHDLRRRGARVIVADGGSCDATLAIAHAHADLALLAPRGRAAQMNAGAAACPGEVMLFLHADTQLPAHADALVLDAVRRGFAWGRFDVRIDSRRPLLRVVERAMNLRSRTSGIATGDQAMFVRGDVFESLGGFPDIALMEDIALSHRLRRLGRPACLRETVLTSGRRWEHAGVWRTVLLMWRLRAAYFFGADPNRLALDYGYRPRDV